MQIFFLAANLYFESQTKRKLKNYLRIKNCVRRAAKLGLRTANDSFNCKGVPLFVARKLFLKP